MPARLKLVETGAPNTKPLGIVSDFVTAVRGHYMASFDLADKLIDHHLIAGMAEVEKQMLASPEGAEAGREILTILRANSHNGYFGNKLTYKIIDAYDAILQKAASPALQ